MTTRVENSYPCSGDGGVKGELLPLNRWNWTGCEFSNEQSSSGPLSMVNMYVQMLSRSKQGTSLLWKWGVWSKKFCLSMYTLCNVWNFNHDIHLCGFISETQLPHSNYSAEDSINGQRIECLWLGGTKLCPKQIIHILMGLTSGERTLPCPQEPSQHLPHIFPGTCGLSGGNSEDSRLCPQDSEHFFAVQRTLTISSLDLEKKSNSEHHDHGSEQASSMC